MNTTDKILADRLRLPSFSKRDRLAAADRLEELSNCVAVLEAKLSKSKALLAKAVEALRPFAEMDLMDDNAPDAAVCVVSAKTVKNVRAVIAQINVATPRGEDHE